MYLAIRRELADYAPAIDRVPAALDLHFIAKLAGGRSVRIRSAVLLTTAVKRLPALALELDPLVPVMGPRRRGTKHDRREYAPDLRPTTVHGAAPGGTGGLEGPVPPSRSASHLSRIMILL
jgi:hypothetical protein